MVTVIYMVEVVTVRRVKGYVSMVAFARGCSLEKSRI